MITTPYFTIGHIGKTGGDAAAMICRAVFVVDNLEPNYKIDSIFDDAKNRSFDGTENKRLLTFRKLPSYILSIAEHMITVGGMEPWTSSFCSELKNGDDELKRMTCSGKYPVSGYLRMCNLREDLLRLLKATYGKKFSIKHERIVSNCPTKAPAVYDHDVYKFFSKEQIQKLYKANPQWARIEKSLYRNLM